MRHLMYADIAIPLFGLVVSGVVLAAGGGRLAAGALAGAVIASADWFVLRGLFALLGRKGEGAGPGRIIGAAALGFKFILLAGFLYLAISTLKFDAVGVAAGAGSLPAGLIAGAMLGGRWKE